MQVKCYEDAIKADKYLAVAYFQQGVSNFLMGDFEEALANFNDTLLYLRGNKYIDYQQLGLKFKLYSCEVLFNRGLCYIYLQQVDQGLQDLSFAAKEKAVPDHDVIEEAIREQAEVWLYAPYLSFADDCRGILSSPYLLVWFIDQMKQKSRIYVQKIILERLNW